VGVLGVVSGEAASPQILEKILSLALQKLRGAAHQKLPMELLVLEDEKRLGAQSPSLQKVKVSVGDPQRPHLGDRPGSAGLSPFTLLPFLPGPLH
jgi:hypothetical protein